jgi:hypothetical protein
VAPEVAGSNPVIHPTSQIPARKTPLFVAELLSYNERRVFLLRAKVAAMHTAILRGTLVGLMGLSIACGRSIPTAPTPSGRGGAVPPPSAPTLPNFPALSGPSRTFTFDHELTYPPTAYTKQSHFVLYENGAFALKYVSLGLEYRGGYTESNGVITFEWEGWSGAGPWGASGTLKDGSLTVRFNAVMQMTDFEDGVYALKE